MTTHRNWTRLLAVHMGVAGGSPLLGALFLFVLSFNLSDAFHFGGFLALGFTVFFAYLFFGALTFLAVLLGSPLLLVISRMRNKALAFCAAAFTGGLVGWVFCAIVVAPGEGDGYALAAKLAGALTGIVGGAVLQLGWRASWRPQPEAERVGRDVGSIGTHPVN